MARDRKGTCLRLSVVAALLLAGASAAAAERALWLRYPAISPDGKTHRLQLPRRPLDGAGGGRHGDAAQTHAAYDTTPVWSPDGSKIAFASDRYGNFDVFVMPAERRRSATAHLPLRRTRRPPASRRTARRCCSARRASTAPRTCSSRPAPSPSCIGSACPAACPCRCSPRRRSTRSSTAPASASPTRTRRATRWSGASTTTPRSPATSGSGTWHGGKHRRLTAFGYDDRQPVWAPRTSVALLSLREERHRSTSGRWSSADPEHPTQVTSHAVHPVRFLIGVARRATSATPRTASCGCGPRARAESRQARRSASPPTTSDRAVEPIDVSAQITEFDVSPDGSEIAFVARAARSSWPRPSTATTRRITNTPEQERSVSFSPDGRSLLYASERGRELEALSHRSHRQGRAELLQRDGVQGDAGGRGTRRGIPAELLAGRQRDRLPRGAHRRSRS